MRVVSLMDLLDVVSSVATRELACCGPFVIKYRPWETA